MEIKRTDTLGAIYIDARSVRKAVFIDEQGIDPKDEFDGTDSTAVHFVAYVQNEPVATARVTHTPNGAHIQRVATKEAFRHQGLAKALIQAIITDGSFSDEKRFYLGAQLTAQGFYKRLGFKPYGNHFYEAGIEHQAMEWKKIDSD